MLIKDGEPGVRAEDDFRVDGSVVKHSVQITGRVPSRAQNSPTLPMPFLTPAEQFWKMLEYGNGKPGDGIHC